MTCGDSVDQVRAADLSENVSAVANITTKPEPRPSLLHQIPDATRLADAVGYSHGRVLLRCHDYPDRRLAAVPMLP